MLFRPKIVQFKDGTYAIRFFTLFGYQYLDLTMDFYELTHSKNHDNFENCKGDLTTVENKIKLYYRQYKPKNKDKEKVLKYDYTDLMKQKPN